MGKVCFGWYSGADLIHRQDIDMPAASEDEKEVWL
jgi:hypothetical protein